MTPLLLFIERVPNFLVDRPLGVIDSADLHKLKPNRSGREGHHEDFTSKVLHSTVIHAVVGHGCRDGTTIHGDDRPQRDDRDV